MAEDYREGIRSTAQFAGHPIHPMLIPWPLGLLSTDEQFWVLASEGTASLLVRETDDAKTFFCDALSLLSPDQGRMVQSTYDDLCRLCKALGSKTVAPVGALFRRSRFPVKPNPVGDCL
jgi:hypothetical protein